jgi:hypothetical protein
MVNSINTIREAFDRWKGALVDQAKQTTRAARHRAHARVTSMEDLIAETPADDIEGVGIKLALYVYMSGVDPETADSAVEQVLSAFPNWGWVLASGLVGVALLLYLWANLSTASEWLLGLLFGILLIVEGAALTSLAWRVRREI